MMIKKKKYAPSSEPVKTGVPPPAMALKSAAFTAPAIGTSAAITPNTSAINKLVAGPASATFTAPVRGFLRLFGLYGTGFMPAKKNPVVKNNTTGIIKDRNGSRCFSGFNVSRPARRAVSSPSRSAS